MDEEESLESFIARAEQADIDAMKEAMNNLIDPVTKFISMGSTVDTLDTEDFERLLNALNYAQFIVSGVMYSHGLSLCTDDEHEHDEEDDDES